MSRYVALYGHGPAFGEVKARLERLLFRGGGWFEIWCGRRLALWFRSSSPDEAAYSVREDSGGALVGRCYGAPAAIRHADDRAKGWGGFVSFDECAIPGDVIVMRDPGGAVPCWRAEIEAGTIFFSHIEDVRAALPARLPVDPGRMRDYALYPTLARRGSGLSGIDQLLPAERQRLNRSGSRCDFFWTPWSYATDASIRDRATGAAALRHAVTTVIHALGRDERSVLASVGGLDSSIVACVLAARDGRPDITVFNGYTDALAGDERRHAQAVARHAGLAFAPRRLDPQRVDLSRLQDVRWQPAPARFFDVTAPAAGLYDLAAETGATSLWTGVGGDNVFFQLAHYLPALDRAETGWRPRAWWSTALDAARYGGTSVWRVLRAMLRHRMSSGGGLELAHEFFLAKGRLPFLSPDVLADGLSPEGLHPLLETGVDIAPAKRFHLLSTAFAGIDPQDPWQPPSGPALRRVAPLFAQPVVEACLRVPTWLLIEGGVDRALARMAFRDLLPESVIRRTSKSNPTRLYDAVALAHAPMIRESLLDGLLCREGILNKAAIEAHFALDPGPSRSALSAALDLYHWELWVRHWSVAHDFSSSIREPRLVTTTHQL